jgi:hypothetical protein
MIENDLTHYCYANFILRGKGFNPDEVTSLIGINPSRSFKRGDRRTKTEKTNHESLSLSENVIGQIASLGIKLSVDIYGPD